MNIGQVFTFLTQQHNLFNMARITLKEHCTQNGYNLVSKVRINASGYPYVTLGCREDGQHTENLYGSLQYSQNMTEGTFLPINTLFVVEATNSQGEKRFKLTDREGEMTKEKLVNYQGF